uniref:DNA-directed RNA polymerase subunit beta n=1 Tax=Nephromyces sp. ex Molgula occidentalis TaxID=2544991 RepID=A0A5C1H826_9APIC|nr:plastid-encoded DNA-directed RNA polymerase beta [Nephromyces sp. ex Molgula occidentalis]
MNYSVLPFSIQSINNSYQSSTNLLIYLLPIKLKLLLPLILHNIFQESHNTYLKFSCNNMKFNTVTYDVNNIYVNTNLNSNYQVSLPIEIYTNFYKFKFNFILFEVPKLNAIGDIILNGLHKTYIWKLQKQWGLYFKKIIKHHSIIYQAYIIFNFNHLISIELWNDNQIKIYDFKYKLTLNLNTLLTYLNISPTFINQFSRYGNSNILNLLLTQSIHKNQKILTYCKIIKTYFNTPTLDLHSSYINTPDQILINYDFINNHLNQYFGNRQKFSSSYLSSDLILIVDTLLDFKFNKRSIPDSDHFGMKKLNTLNDLILTQIDFIVEKRLKMLKTVLTTKKSFTKKIINQLNNNKYIVSFKEYFTINPLIQYSDQINSLSKIMHKLKVTKTVSSHIKNFNIREIRFSELGKLCLINTSEGLNSGLITYLPENIYINSHYIIKTPSSNKKLTNENFKSKVFDTFKTEKNDLIFNTNSIRKKYSFNKLTQVTFSKNSLNVRPNLNWELNISKTQVFSLAENLIPFIFYNDPSRSLMGARMQMQSVPLLYKQKAYIITGTEQLLSRKQTWVYSLQEGIITYVSSYKIIIRDILNREVSYYLSNYQFSNQNTLINFTPSVWVGERVSIGQIIAVNQDFEDNEFSIGTNLSVLYGSYLGYEFEDALIWNKRLLYNNIFTSLHLTCYEISFMINNILIPEFSSINIPKYTLFEKRNLDKFGIIKEGAKILDNDLLITKINIRKFYSYKESINQFLSTLFGYRLRNIIDKSLKNAVGNSGRIVKLELGLNKNFKTTNCYLKIRLFIIKQRFLEIGDKLCGRHGNKGIISYISNPVDLPYNLNSMSPDLITSPIGVPSRMNLGQLIETILGINCLFTNKRFLINSNLNEKFGSNYLKTLLYNYIKESNYYNGYINNSYTLGKDVFFDGRTGKMLKNTVLFGCSFYTKLIHMVKDKIHYRTIGPYSTLTQQPVKGRSQQGGQRFGEMEVWALEAFGSSYNLKELLSYKSDDINGRKNLTKYLLGTQELKPSFIPESFQLVLTELKGLALHIESLLINPNESNIFVLSNKL